MIDNTHIVEQIIKAAKEVHTILGSGFLERVYEEALHHELTLRGIQSERQYNINIVYKGTILELKYIPDLYVEKSVLVELKAVRDLTMIEEAQLTNYLRVANIQTGLLLNFGTDLTIKRKILNVKGAPTTGRPNDTDTQESAAVP